MKKGAPDLRRVLCPGCASDDPLHIYDIDFRGQIIEIGVCSRCALGYQVSMPGAEEMAAYYRETSVFQESGSGSRQASLNQARYKFLDGAIDQIGAGTAQPLALDVGCGFGAFLGTLGGKWRRFGLELNPERAAQAREVFGVTVREATLEEAGLPAGSVDFLSAFGVVEHLLDPQSFFREVKRVLRPDGFAMINVPDTTEPLVAVSQFFTIEHNLYFTSATLRALLESHGFRIIKMGRMTDDYPDISCLFAQGPKGDLAPILPMNEKEALLLERVIDNYKLNREKYVQSILARLQKNAAFLEPESLAVYGAGEHTRELAILVPELKRVRVFIDANRGKWGKPFLGGTIYSPEEVRLLEIKKILISSKAYEREIVRELRDKYDNYIKLITIYIDPDN